MYQISVILKYNSMFHIFVLQAFSYVLSFTIRTLGFNVVQGELFFKSDIFILCHGVHSVKVEQIWFEGILSPVDIYD